MTLGFWWLRKTRTKFTNISRIFNTGPYGDPPLKIKISKIGLRSDLSWPKLGLEPKFHDPGTFGGFGKREQTHTQDSCFISIDISNANVINERRVVSSECQSSLSWPGSLISIWMLDISYINQFRASSLQLNIFYIYVFVVASDRNQWPRST